MQPLIEQLRVTSSPIVTNVKFHVKFTSAWHAGKQDLRTNVCHTQASYSSSGISVQMDVSPLGLYYRYASL